MTLDELLAAVNAAESRCDAAWVAYCSTTEAAWDVVDAAREDVADARRRLADAIDEARAEREER